VKLTFKAAARSSSAAGAWPMARARRGLNKLYFKKP
jgi:hypothetical protein